MMDLTGRNVLAVHSFAQKPELRDRIDLLSMESWPRFLHSGNVHHWHLLFDMFSEYQLLFLDAQDGLAAVGHTVPFIWDGSIQDLPRTIEEILIRGMDAIENRRKPNTLSAVAAMVDPLHRGRNISVEVISQMKKLAAGHSCTALVAPLRPTLKSRYPLIPMDRYVNWTRTDGSPFDPWIRVHHRLGAVPLGVAPATLTVEGTAAQWEQWTETAFPDSGMYILPGALQPMTMDREEDTGRYEDPNFWVKHSV